MMRRGKLMTMNSQRIVSTTFYHSLKLSGRLRKMRSRLWLSNSRNAERRTIKSFKRRRSSRTEQKRDRKKSDLPRSSIRSWSKLGMNYELSRRKKLKLRLSRHKSCRTKTELTLTRGQRVSTTATWWTSPTMSTITSRGMGQTWMRVPWKERWTLWWTRTKTWVQSYLLWDQVRSRYQKVESAATTTAQATELAALFSDILSSQIIELYA